MSNKNNKIETSNNTINKTPAWKKTLLSVTLAATLASCNTPNDKIILNWADKSVKFNVEYYGREPIILDISIRKVWDTYEWKIIEWGDLFATTRLYEANNIETIFSDISDFIWQSAEKAHLSSIKSIEKLSSKGRAKAERAKWEYKKLLEKDNNSIEDIEIEYKTK